MPRRGPNGALPIEELLKRLLDNRVDFVIAGLAALAQGSVHVSADLDIYYRRAPESLQRLVAALEPLRPRLRGGPPGLPFRWDARTLRAGLNFTLDTDIGPIDLLGEIAGIGQYEAALTLSESLPLFGRPCAVLTLEALIRSKRPAGRPRDLESVIELEALRELRSKETD